MADIPAGTRCPGIGLRRLERCDNTPLFLMDCFNGDDLEMGIVNRPSKRWYCRACAQRIIDQEGDALRFGWFVQDGEAHEEVFYRSGQGDRWALSKLGVLVAGMPAPLWDEEEAQALAARQREDERQRIVHQYDWWIVTEGKIDHDTFDWWSRSNCWYSEKHGAVMPDEGVLHETCKEAAAYAISYHMARICYHESEERKLRAMYDALPNEEG